MEKDLKSKDSTMPDIRLNWFDRTIGFFSPRSLLKRKRAKIFNAYLGRKYEGADAGRQTAGWRTNNASANAEIATAIPRMRDRARDLVRNNPYAGRGLQVIANNVVGKGIKIQIKMDRKSTVSSIEKRSNTVWNAWADTTACDFEGIHNLAGLQRLVMRAVPESGEVLVRIRRVPRLFALGDSGRIEVPPIQLQVLEGDFLSSEKQSGILPNGNQIIQGVEIDKGGRRVAYHIFQSHPGGNDIVSSARFTTVRVPASEILHVYRMDRPGQLRGMTWLANIILRLRDFDVFEYATLKRQQASSMYAAFIHDIEGVDDIDETKNEKEFNDKFEAGMVEELPPGKTITFSDPPGAEGFKDYSSVNLHGVSSGLGITYESLTGDFGEVNFSSARMGFLEMQRNFDTWRSIIMINPFLKPVFAAFADAAELIGLNMKNARPVFGVPKREMIDPLKETQALKTAMRIGIKSHSAAIRDAGEDPDTHFEELKSDNDTIDRLHLTLDSDPRKVNNVGTKNDDTDDETVPAKKKPASSNKKPVTPKR